MGRGTGGTSNAMGGITGKKVRRSAETWMNLITPNDQGRIAGLGRYNEQCKTCIILSFIKTSGRYLKSKFYCKNCKNKFVNLFRVEK